jgi:transcriptional regulator with XRE-family HTH domain
MTELRASDTVAAKIRSYREWLDWSRAEMARQTGLSENVIENIETGRPDADGQRRRDVTVDELLTIARSLDLPLFALLPKEAAEPSGLERERAREERAKREAAIEGQHEEMMLQKNRLYELEDQRIKIEKDIKDARKRVEVCRQMIIMYQGELRGITERSGD